MHYRNRKLNSYIFALDLDIQNLTGMFPWDKRLYYERKLGGWPGCWRKSPRAYKASPTLSDFHAQGASKEAYDQYTPGQRRGWEGVSGTTETTPHAGSRRHQGKRRRGLATATKYA